jgi:predicted lipid-binding transport protein (Tim44 family)
MLYGDIHMLDLLVFAGIAAFLIYRLRNVLGKRTGFQKKATNNPIIKEGSVEKKLIPDLKPNEEKLIIAYEAIESFDHKNFLEGAKIAFETIIVAFNNADKKTLKNLLTKEVYSSFEKAIDEKNHNENFQLYSLTVDGVEKVVIEKEIIYITLKITSEQFKNDDESLINKKQDIWTFQKNINSNSPIWLLSST